MYSIGNTQQPDVVSSSYSSSVDGEPLIPEEGEKVLIGHARRGLSLKNVVGKREMLTAEELLPLDEESHPADGILPELNRRQENQPLRRRHKRRAGLREAAASPGTATRKQLEKWLSGIITDLRHYSRAADRELLLLVRNPSYSDFKAYAFPDELPWQRHNALHHAIVGEGGECGDQLVAKIERFRNSSGVGLSEVNNNNTNQVKVGGGGCNQIAPSLNGNNCTVVSPSVVSYPPPNSSNDYVTVCSSHGEVDPVELMYHCQLALFQHIESLAVDEVVTVPVLRKRCRSNENGESRRGEGYEGNEGLDHDDIYLPISKCKPQRGGAKSRLSVAIGRIKKPEWWDTDQIGEEWEFFGHRVRHDGWSKRPHRTLQEVVNSKRRHEHILSLQGQLKGPEVVVQTDDAANLLPSGGTKDDVLIPGRKSAWKLPHPTSIET